jgi:hypothetical protein
VTGFLQEKYIKLIIDFKSPKTEKINEASVTACQFPVYVLFIPLIIISGKSLRIMEITSNATFIQPNPCSRSDFL